MRGEVERAPWPSFIEEFTRVHEMGQHVSIIGPTGQGKTTLARELLIHRAEARQSFIVVIVTKKKDDSFDSFGWPIVKTWPPGYGKNQVLLWPPYGTDPERAPARQRRIIAPALREIFNDGSRVVYLDEVWYLDKKMKLGEMIDQFLTQGRSQKLTVVAGTQRPVNVPRTMFSEPSWLFFFGTRDADELRRVGEIGGGSDTARVRDELTTLNKYEFLCVRKDTGEMVRSKVQI